jgi:hypothetical protein
MGRRALLATVTCGWEGSGALLKAEDMSVDSWKIDSCLAATFGMLYTR